MLSLLDSVFTSSCSYFIWVRRISTERIMEQTRLERNLGALPVLLLQTTWKSRNISQLLFGVRIGLLRFTELIRRIDSDIKLYCGCVSLRNPDKRGISQCKPFTDLSLPVIIWWLQLSPLIDSSHNIIMRAKSSDKKKKRTSQRPLISFSTTDAHFAGDNAPDRAMLGGHFKSGGVRKPNRWQLSACWCWADKRWRCVSDCPRLGSRHVDEQRYFFSSQNW